jgi:putative flippase GtrA
VTAPRLSRRELTRFLKFGAVGTLGAVIDIGTFHLLHARLGWPEVPASICSFVAAVTSNFVWNRYWTYPDSRSKPLRRQAGQFALVSAIGLAIRTPVFALLLGPYTRLATAFLDTPRGATVSISASSLGADLALVSVIVIVLFWNFLANRLWTYADIDRPRAEPAGRMADSPPV